MREYFPPIKRADSGAILTRPAAVPSNVGRLWESLLSRARRAKRHLRRLGESIVGDRRGYHRALRMTLREWLFHHQREIAFERCRWMGLRSLKNPLDAWIYQEILHDVRPDVVIEIGSYEGGTTLYLAHLLELLGNGIVVSIDVDRSRFRASHPRIRALTGDSTSREILDAVRELCRGKTVLVVHDADHAKDRVLADLEAYAPLVSRDSYLIVEDGFIDLFEPGDGIGTWADGPLAAIDEFLSRNTGFAPDPERERYLVTYNPRGYLRRVA